jgi:hypothetical protein
MFDSYIMKFTVIAISCALATTANVAIEAFTFHTAPTRHRSVSSMAVRMSAVEAAPAVYTFTKSEEIFAEAQTVRIIWQLK